MSNNGIPLKLNKKVTLEGINPIVIIGPNGSGKTRFGINIVTQQGAEFIGALRNISLEENIPMQSLERATQELNNQMNHHSSHFWSISSEINYLFSKLLAEDAASAMKVRDTLLTKQQPEIENTKLMQLRTIWQEFFPGREIKFETYSPKIQSKFTSTPTIYAAQQMSDGERVALYLGSRVLNAKPGLIVIDEPEIHFHARLSIRFWNTMQNLRPDLRFIYLTHDLTFALSRQEAQFVIVRPNLVPEVVPLGSGIPNELAESILGAASFSIFANRIIFCEGDENSDYALYTHWFATPNTVVLPIGSCKDVLQCANAFCNQNIVSGVNAIGIVDRDYWPEEYLKTFPNYITPLKVHEIENIYCLPEVFSAIGQHFSLEIPVIGELYEKFIIQAKERFKGELLARQILERFKRRCIGRLNTVTNDLHVIGDLNTLESQCVSALQPSNWGFNPRAIYDEERKLLENALTSTNPMEFLTLFPGKVFIQLAAKSFGLETSAYKELVNKALVADDRSSLFNLKPLLEDVLSKILPSR